MSLASFIAGISRLARPSVAGRAKKRKKRTARRGRRRGVLESLFFARAPLLSIVPRRYATLEALEARDLLTLTVTGNETAPEGAMYRYTITVSNLPQPGEFVTYATIARQGETTDHTEFNPTSFWVAAGTMVQKTSEGGS